MTITSSVAVTVTLIVRILSQWWSVEIISNPYPYLGRHLSMVEGLASGLA